MPKVEYRIPDLNPTMDPDPCGSENKLKMSLFTHLNLFPLLSHSLNVPHRQRECDFRRLASALPVQDMTPFDVYVVLVFERINHLVIATRTIASCAQRDACAHLHTTLNGGTNDPEAQVRVLTFILGP